MRFGLITILSITVCISTTLMLEAKTINPKRELKLYDKELAKKRDNKSSTSKKCIYKKKPIENTEQEQPFEKRDDFILEDVEET